MALFAYIDTVCLPTNVNHIPLKRYSFNTHGFKTKTYTKTQGCVKISSDNEPFILIIKKVPEVINIVILYVNLSDQGWRDLWNAQLFKVNPNK